MLHEDAIRHLMEAGLSDKESRVYVAMLALGASGVQEIAARAELPRASVYTVLEVLMTRGLVSTYEEEKRAMYVAETPKKLVELVEQEARLLDAKREKLVFFVPELESLFHTQRNKPVVRFYEGEDGLRSFRDYLGRHPSSRIDAFIRLDARLGAAAAHDADRRMKLFQPNQRTRLLYVADPGVLLPTFPPQARPPLHEVRFAKRLPFSFEGELGVQEHMAYLSTVNPRVMACLIESPALADLLRALFELAWQTATSERE